MAKGYKTGGRKKGTPNKTTEEVRAVIKQIIENNLATIESDLKQLVPRDRINIINQLLKHVLPPPIVDISQFSERDLDILLERLISRQNEQAGKNT